MRMSVTLFFTILLYSISIITGCSNSKDNSNQEVNVNKNQVQEYTLNNDSGRVVVVSDNDGNTVDFIVMAEGLDPKEEYFISYKSKDNGLIFGPKENVELSVGEIKDETQFIPNRHGELMVSMLHPMRVVEGNSNSYISIETKDGKEVMKTESILITTTKE